MYRIMIVDDEILVRVGLKSTIDWNSIGFEIVAEASNGEQAYEQFLSYEPDVILTDIKMPKMDGLKLTELVKARNPKVKVVILTCYDEFAYAREALKLGASNYILKSEIEDEELINLLITIHNELDAEMGKMERYSILQRQISSNINNLKEKLLSDLIDSKVMLDQEFYRKCESLNLNLENRNFVLSVLYKDNMEDFANYSDADWQLLDSGVINIVNEIMNEKGIKFLTCTKGNNFVLVIIKEDITKSDVEGIIVRMKEAILKYLNISITAILSKEFSAISLTSGAYKDCEKGSQMMFYNKKGSLLYTNGDKLSEANVVDFRESYTKPLLESMDEENTNKAEDIVAGIEKIFIDKRVNPVQAKLHYISLISDVLEHYSGCFSDENEVNDYSNYSNLILNSAKISDVSRLLKIFAENVVNSVKKNRMVNSRNIIHQAKSYVEKNYDKKVSLESLAAHINLSKQYLCYIFKRETGENVSVYINKVKVEKAKELIKKYDYKVKELFDKVGFSDQQYFCKIFKKITGMTIAEYKEDILKKVQG